MEKISGLGSLDSYSLCCIASNEKVQEKKQSWKQLSIENNRKKENKEILHQHHWKS